MNHEIRAREVRLIDDEGQQLGVVPVRDALRLATERGLDLVEVAPTASPVVCRIMDYGRFKYEQDKRDREARKKQHVVEIKELVIKTMNIEEHDLGILAHKAERILQGGDKLKLTMRFRGREIVHADLGRDVFKQFVGMIAQVGQVEMEPRVEGRTLNMVMAPRPEVMHALRQQVASGGAPKPVAAAATAQAAPAAVPEDSVAAAPQ